MLISARVIMVLMGQADGVALGGVQALYARLQAQEQRLAELASLRETEQAEARRQLEQSSASLAAAEARAAALEARLARLESIVLASAEATTPAR